MSNIKLTGVGDLKKQGLVVALAAGILALGGCGSSSSEQDSTMLTEDQMSPEQLEDAANAAQEAAAQAIAENAAQEAAEQAAANDDPYPYTAVLNCGMNGFDNINLMACMGGDVGTEIELNNNGQYGLYKVYNLPSDWQQTERGVEIPLAKTFGLKMQNSSENLTMGLRIFDNSGNILFQKQVAQWGVITVSN